ncbi:MAG: PorV/PorQ family protein [Bacteroidota bacterium]
MKKYTHLFAGIAIIAASGMITPAFGQTSGSSAGLFKKVGAAGGQFLKIPVGARATGMAGAFSAVSDDLTAIYWNPSGLANLQGINANLSYNNWFAGFTHNFAAVSVPISENYVVALNIVSFSTGNIEKTTVENEGQNGTGEFYSVNDFAIGGTFAGKVTEQFAFGVNAKYVKNGFSNVRSDGFVFDAGTSYEMGVQGIKLGFSIHNFGGDQQFGGEDLNVTTSTTGAQEQVSTPFALPLSFRAGISGNVLEGDEVNDLIVALDFETLSDTPEQYALGAEYTWNDLFSVRGGYRLGHDEINLAGGVGVKYESTGFGGQVDYSIQPTKSLGIVNRISLGFTLK